MLKKFLKEVVTIVVGKQAEDIVELLIGEKYVNEFLIAKKMDLTINQTRNILYKISDYGLVSSTRKKDKKKGWYTYSWKIEIYKALLFLKSELVKKVNQINNQVNSRETKQFYVCERCNVEINEENAMLYDFTCNECGDIFILKNNEKFLRDLKRNLSKLNRELELIEEEIEKQGNKLDKKKDKEIKKQEQLKVDTRKKAAVIRKAAKDKLAKENPVKKKVKKVAAPKGRTPKDFNKKSLQGAKKVAKKIVKKKIIKKLIKKKVSKKKKEAPFGRTPKNLR